MTSTTITLTFIKLYQSLLFAKTLLLVSVFGIKYRCKHTPTCSQYTAQMVAENGTIRGLWYGLKRFSQCW